MSFSNPLNEQPIACCAYCDEELFECDEVLEEWAVGYFCCEDCFRDYVRDNLSDYMDEIVDNNTIGVRL